jgi:hypothetical protein
VRASEIDGGARWRYDDERSNLGQLKPRRRKITTSGRDFGRSVGSINTRDSISRVLSLVTFPVFWDPASQTGSKERDFGRAKKVTTNYSGHLSTIEANSADNSLSSIFFLLVQKENGQKVPLYGIPPFVF